MSQQWEVCRVCSVRIENKTQYQDVIAIDFYSPSGVITKWPALNSFAQMVGHLSAAGWELVTVQHAESGGNGGDHMYSKLLGRTTQEYPDMSWQFVRCELASYFKRPMEPGRKIDNVFPNG